MMIALVATFGVAAGVGLWLLLRRRRKSASEMERERRLAVNAVGRMTDGTLLDAPDSIGKQGNSRLLFYRYSVASLCRPGSPEIRSDDPPDEWINNRHQRHGQCWL